MELSLENLREILSLSKVAIWRERIPIVNAKVRIAINSLASQDQSIFNGPAEALRILLKKNKGIEKIFFVTDAVTIAFAIREARL